MAYEELKERQSVMWGNGPYQRITDTLTDIHELVIENMAPQPGDRWLDLACGTGAIAEGAAAAGAQVTGLDLSPVLIDTAKERAAEQGLEIDYVVGDAEKLAFDDASFDKAAGSCSRPTTRPQHASLLASPPPAAASRSPTGRPRAAWRRCSR